MERDRNQNTERRAELLASAEKFLDLLHNYDSVGEGAYFKESEQRLFVSLPQLFDKSKYYVFEGKKYIWMKAPYLRLAITSEGDLFISRRPHSMEGARRLGKIQSFLDQDLWGKNIYRVYTSARHGTDQHESAMFHYHDLHLRRRVPIENVDSGPQENKYPDILMISDVVKGMEPVWINFIVGLDYEKEQGEAFARGYAAELANLPILGKLRALDEQEPQCMAAGFRAAGIDENEALARYQKSSEDQ